MAHLAPCRRMAAIPFALLVSACATTGSTLRSGVPDGYFDHPPFYAGQAPPPDSARIASLPIGFQRGVTQPPSFEPSASDGSAMAELLAEMNAYLWDLRVTVAVGGRLAGTPPDVRFGCPADVLNECIKERDTPDGAQPFLLAVGRPSRVWIAAADSALSGAGAERVLVLTVEIGQYNPRQRNVAGDKEVELGTDYRASLPWLTALNEPVQVLQLTGALVGRDGRAIRIGAEGMLARRTSLPLSAIGVQRLLTDQDVEQLRTLRRGDLPGRPLVWQAALRQLVFNLTGRTGP